MRDCVIHEFIPPRSWYARREPPESDEVLAQRREVEKALLRRLFSPAGWDGLTPCQRRLVDMVMGEIVPGRKGWRRGYGGGVRLIIGGVPGRDQAQIPFWVNGGRLPRRSGHCLVLPTRNSFVVRAGYMRVNESEQECLAKVPSFLQDVYDIAEVLGVDLVGTSGDRPDGIGMEDMVKLGLSLYSYYSLCWLQVRGLPRQTYLHEWYRHFADGDRRPPSDNGGICCEAAVEPDARELLERSVALGITQADLAFILGVAPTLVCMFKHGRRRWPPGFLHRIKTFLDAAETAVVGTIDGPWQPLEDPPRRSRTRSEA
jgi:hypothetical protein